MVLHLKVEATSDSSRDETAIGTRSLHLRLVPADGFASLSVMLGRVTVAVFKVVGERKQDSQEQGLGSSHDHDLTKGSERILVQKRGHNVGNNVKKAQGNGILSVTLDKVILQFNANKLSTTLLKVENLGVEHRGKPVASKNRQVKENLETVHPGSGRVSQWVVVEKQHGLSTKAIGVFIGVVGVGVVLQKFRLRG